LALATGPEGVHQLKVDRLANGQEWAVGGEDAFCLNPDGSLKTVLTSGATETLALDSSQSPYELTVASGDYRAKFTLTWNGAAWAMSAEMSGDGGVTYSNSSATPPAASASVTTQDLGNYMKDVFETLFSPNKSEVSVTVNSNGSLTLTSDVHSVIVKDSAYLLGMKTDFVPMRVRPTTTTEALGLSTSFRVQVGSQGTLVSSKTFDNAGNPDLSSGDILGVGTDGENYTFRVGAHDYQVDVTVKWNTDHWTIESDTGKRADLSANAHLTITDMTDFLRDKSVLSAFSIERNSATQFSIASRDNYLISISDVKGDLAARMGMVNTNPVITIDVQETDSLETIRNKINEKYQEAYGLTDPEQWVHAALEQDTDQSWYLTIASDVAGEAQRITLMGDEDGNMQTLRRLGLVKLDPATGNPADTTQIYREVTAYSKIAEDASFTFDGVRYLSADNKFDKARRVPAGTSRTDYSAKTLETVSEGIWLDLKGVGQTAITVRHHVKEGSVKALEEIRDGLIPQLKGDLDEIAWTLIKNFNAYQYSGYGVGEDGNLDTTGTAFFNTLGFKAGSSSLLNVTEKVSNDVSLVGAAMGKLDENGKAVYGRSAGNGSGTNASRMASLQTSKLLNSNSASLGDFYEAYLAKIGSEAGRASLMYKAQKNLTDQIQEQRLSVMGVNIDEEMLDILKFNHAFNAMSRYVTTIDEMLDRIINGFGLVGR
jgi:flagellar hook-associated protein 1 FlgK